MNEQIKQLAEQARVQDRGYFIYQYGGPTGHQSVEKAIDLEKFAELIIKETLQVARAGVEFGNSMEDAVYNYFGVDE